ncbi:hypothetical protein SELMODRAFT_417518 [Selaginella moellendorffii]|uniref:Uncharacterized protein n=1 Tax=Selaginella moellendorffii TaxID=88036 RepID=D8S2H7_SELML|nr:hypothetical protein SELMODRAFT_417518 [Selaginella moellendorffii]
MGAEIQGIFQRWLPLLLHRAVHVRCDPSKPLAPHGRASCEQRENREGKCLAALCGSLVAGYVCTGSFELFAWDAADRRWSFCHGQETGSTRGILVFEQDHLLLSLLSTACLRLVPYTRTQRGDRRSLSTMAPMELELDGLRLEPRSENQVELRKQWRSRWMTCRTSLDFAKLIVSPTSYSRRNSPGLMVVDFEFKALCCIVRTTRRAFYEDAIEWRQASKKWDLKVGNAAFCKQQDLIERLLYIHFTKLISFALLILAHTGELLESKDAIQGENLCLRGCEPANLPAQFASKFLVHDQLQTILPCKLLPRIKNTSCTLLDTVVLPTLFSLSKTTRESTVVPTNHPPGFSDDEMLYRAVRAVASLDAA